MNLKISTANFNIIPKISFRADSKQTVPDNKLEHSPQKDSFEMSVGYVNDTHGQTNNMMRILSGIKGDLRLSGGDNDIGDEKNDKIHLATTKFLNIADIKASALGNHEIDISQKDCIEAIKRMNGEMLAINFEQTPLS